MALSDWRVTLSEVRRTASMPCIIEVSKLLAWRPRVSDSARTWFSTADDSARAFSLTTVSMASVERSSESSMVCACRTSVSDKDRTWLSTAAVSAPAFWLNAASMAMAERCMELSTSARRSEKAASSARVRSTSCTSRASARLASVASSATV